MKEFFIKINKSDLNKKAEIISNEIEEYHDEVIVTGYDLGMNTSGGFSEYIRVPKEWIIKKPDNFELEESMAYGTAGLTAGLCVRKILLTTISVFVLSHLIIFY